MDTRHFLIALVALATSALIVHASPRGGLHYGAAVPVSGGTARAWVAIDEDGSTHSMGVAIDERALVALPRLSAGLDITLPAPAGVAAPRLQGGAPASMRLRYDAPSRSYLVVMEPATSAPALRASR